MKPNFLRLSLDLKSLLIYDTVNVNLLEYDLSGKFSKIVLKAENCLGNMLSFDFSGDRQHMVTCEVQQDKKSSMIDSFVEAKPEKDNLEYKKDFSIKFRSRNHIFKLKLYRYKDCECHRKAQPKSRLTMFNRSFGFNQSFNNFSAYSDSAELMQ